MTGVGLSSALLSAGRSVGSPEHEQPSMGGVLN